MKDLEEKVGAFLTYINKKRAPLEKETRATAIGLLREYFRKLRLDFGYTPKVEDLFPVSPEIIIEQILRADYLEFEALPPEIFAAIKRSDPTSEIAGMVSKTNNLIAISNKFK